MNDSLVIEERYRGFEKVAHGGYVSGLMARGLGRGARVSLRRPVPMGRPLVLEQADATVTLREGDNVLATGSPTSLDVAVPAPVSIEEAEAASKAYPGHGRHPFPGCFCCGPQRERGDGLRIFPGPLAGRGGVAALWVPEGAHADAQGVVRPEIVWAAFDCPELWALIVSAPADSQERVVTGTLETELRAPVRAGQRYVVVAWPSGVEGRKRFADAVLFSAEGEPVAVSRQTAIVTETGVPLGVGSYAVEAG